MAMNFESASLAAHGFNKLGWIRQVALMVGLAASITLGVVVVLWSQGGDYRPLSSNIDPSKTSLVIQTLRQENIPFKLEDYSNVILVPGKYLDKARIALASDGISGGIGSGFEALKEVSGFGTSQFMENIHYRHALEQELARTISQINSVENARVHLAVPKESAFLMDEKGPQASVFVDLNSGVSLNKSQVNAIVNLVAASVPGMKSKAVSVVDQSGNLLTNSEDAAGLGLTERQFSYQRQLEKSYAQRVISILTPIVGSGNVRAQVNADLDFTQTEQTQETYNPDARAVRSEFSSQEQRSGSLLATGVPGSLSNQPAGGDAGGGEQEGVSQNQTPSSSRQESTKNYEVDRFISHTKPQIGAVQRLSVAVILNDKLVKKGNKTESQPLSESEMKHVQSLVRNAIGYNAARGDSVSVVNTAFAASKTQAVVPLQFWEQPWFPTLVKQVLGGFFVLFLLLFVIRPTLRGLIARAVVEANARSEAEAKAIEVQQAKAAESAGPHLISAASGAGDLELPSDFSDQERNNAFVKKIVDKDPRLVAQIVKSWVQP